MAVTILLIGILVFAAHFFAVLFEKTGIPDVLPLFLIGLVLGPLTGLVDPTVFGSFGKLFATITLSVILFEGGLRMKIGSVLKSFPKSLSLIFLNLIGSVALVIFSTQLFFDIPLITSVVIGVILSGTSATIIVPLVNKLRIKESTKAMLGLESTLNNVVNIVLVFGLLEAQSLKLTSFLSLAKELGVVFLSSLILGILAAFMWSKVLNLFRDLKHSSFTTPAFILTVFGLAELLGANGAITAFISGITLGNLPKLNQGRFRIFEKIADFHFTKREDTLLSSLVFLLKTYFFVFIGLTLDLTNTSYIIWGGAITVILFALRLGVVKIVFGKALPWFDKQIARIMIPKGLTEAALLTLIGSSFLNSISYPVVLFSIIITSILTFVVKNKSDKKESELASV